MEEKILELQEKMYEAGDLLAEGILNGEFKTINYETDYGTLLFVDVVVGNKKINLAVNRDESKMYDGDRGILFREGISTKLADYLLAEEAKIKVTRLQESIAKMQNELQELQTKKAV